jgi:2-dehydropantoate 2-reductase
VRFVIIGAGAIGGVVGVRLDQAGGDVLLVARGADHDAIATDGLTLETPQQRVTVTIAVARTADAVSFGEDDVVLLATKSQDTAAALEALRVAARADTPVVCLQNGVENERIALRSFAQRRVRARRGECVPGNTSAPRPAGAQLGSVRRALLLGGGCQRESDRRRVMNGDLVCFLEP